MSKLSQIIFIIVSVGIFFTYIDPTYQEIKTLNEEKELNNQRLEDVETLDREYKGLESKYKDISPEEQELLKKILPETVDNTRLNLDISNIAKLDVQGVQLRNFTVSGGPIAEEAEKTQNNQRSTTENNSKYGVITIGFSATASYEDFKRFMRELEESLRVVDITDFSVSAGETGFYNYSVKLNTYWLR